MMLRTCGRATQMKILSDIGQAPYKLEVGSGNNPQPGYIHLDINPFQHVEIQCDLSTEKIPLPDGSCTELVAYHVLEHFPWRTLTPVIMEWARVLAPGGILKLRTPDLKFICETYLAGRTTREWPGDEGAMLTVFGDCGPSQWAVIKLHSGQDYPGNTHFWIADMTSLTQLLLRNGFKAVQRANLGAEYSPGEIQATAIKA